MKSESVLSQGGCFISSKGLDEPEQHSLQSKDDVNQMAGKSQSATNEKYHDQTPPDSTASLEVNDATWSRERTVDPFIDSHSVGLIDEREARMKILQIFSSLSLSEVGREGLRHLNVYEVLRVWHLLETDSEIL